jgi:hydrogenase maturation protease
VSASGAVVVGIGQASAGDDGVGLVVARALAASGLAVRECADASVLLSLLEEGRRVVVVDAVVGGGAPGSVMRLDASAIASGPSPLSSHGIGIAEAIELARTLFGEASVAEVEIVGVAIERPSGARVGLSDAVAAAVEPAAAMAGALAAAGPGPRLANLTTE